MDAERAEYFLVAIGEGDVTVTREKGEADLSLRGNKALFDDVFRGRTTLMAALLRGAVTFEGSPAPLGPFQRLFPGPPHSSHPRAKSDTVGRRA